MFKNFSILPATNVNPRLTFLQQYKIQVPYLSTFEPGNPRAYLQLESSLSVTLRMYLLLASIKTNCHRRTIFVTLCFPFQKICSFICMTARVICLAININTVSATKQNPKSQVCSFHILYNNIKIKIFLKLWKWYTKYL